MVGPSPLQTGALFCTETCTRVALTKPMLIAKERHRVLLYTVTYHR